MERFFVGTCEAVEKEEVESLKEELFVLRAEFEALKKQCDWDRSHFDGMLGYLRRIIQKDADTVNFD